MNSPHDGHFPQEERAAERSAAGPRPRKEYLPPELFIYGSLRELTRAANDGPQDAMFGGSIQTG